MTQFGKSGVSERLTKPGTYGFTSKTPVYQKKGKYVLVNLDCKKGRMTLSAGINEKGQGYDSLSITAEVLGICAEELGAVKTAKNKEKALVKLAKAISKFFSGNKVKCKVVQAVKDGKKLTGQSDKLPLLNFSGRVG